MTIKIDQLADAINAVPGVAVVFFNGQPATTQTISSGTFADIPGSALPEQFFVAPVAGTYALSIEAGVLSSGTLNQWDTVQYQLVVDESGYGGFTEQIIGNTTVDYEWKVGVRNYTAAQQQPEYKHITATVVLGAGTHKVKWQAKTTSGSPVVNNSINFKITGQLVSGSGAGGVIVTEKTDDQQRSGTGATPTEVTQLQLAITTTADEYVDLRFIGRTSTSATPDTPEVYLKIDSGSWIMMSQFTGNTGWACNSAWSAMAQFSAGDHIVRIGIKCFNNTAWTLCVGGAGLGVPVSRFQAIQYRGGLVPVEKDGVVVIDTPRSLNFVGDNFAVTAENGCANVDSIYDGFQENRPLSTPSIYDDEFNGSSLDPKWTWYIAGAPASGNEYNNVAHGRLNVCADVGTSVFSSVHCLCQDLPAQNFEFYAKLYSTRLTNYQSVDLVLLDSATPNAFLIHHGFHNTSGSAAALWGNTWTGSYSDYLNNANFPLNPTILKLGYNVSTKVVTVYHSHDGFNWNLLYTSSGLVWTPTRFGLAFNGSQSAGLTYCNVEWFRVTLL